MKVLSIGRDSGCNIVVNDEKDMISRRHAMLYIYSTGKMTIVDQGQNGTYVNGIRITPNVPYPVTRKDVVSFAHIRQLDWNLVPNNFALLRNIVLGILAAVLIAGGVYWFLNRTPDIEPVKTVQAPPVTESSKDSTQTKETDSVTQKEDATLPKGLLPSREKEKKKKQKEKEQKEKEESKKQENASPKEEENNKTIIM